MLPVSGHAEDWAQRNVRQLDAWIAQEIASTDQRRAERDAATAKEIAEFRAWEKSGRPLKCFYVICGVM